MRVLTVTLGVLLSLVAVLLVVVAGALFLDGDAGAGGLAVFSVMVTLLCALLLLRAVPARRSPTAPRTRRGRSDPGSSVGDSTPTPPR